MEIERRCDYRDLSEYSSRFPHVIPSDARPARARARALIRCRSKKKVPVSCLATKQLRRGNYFACPPPIYTVAASPPRELIRPSVVRWRSSSEQRTPIRPVPTLRRGFL